MMVQHEAQRNRMEGGYLLRALQLMGDVSHGILHLHQAGFVHRDLAARNMFVECNQKSFIGGRPHAKVGDFGQARKIPEGETAVRYGELVYDRSLLAPENYHMNGIHSKKSDVFQFGKVCWEAFTFNFGAYPKFFAEAKGLNGLDLDQITLRKRAKKGQVSTGDFLEVRALHEFDFVEGDNILITRNGEPVQLRLARLCAQCFQSSEDDRCTMNDCVAELENVEIDTRRSITDHSMRTFIDEDVTGAAIEMGEVPSMGSVESAMSEIDAAGNPRSPTANGQAHNKWHDVRLSTMSCTTVITL